MESNNQETEITPGNCEINEPVYHFSGKMSDWMTLPPNLPERFKPWSTNIVFSWDCLEQQTYLQDGYRYFDNHTGEEIRVDGVKNHPGTITCWKGDVEELTDKIDIVVVPRLPLYYQWNFKGRGGGK